MAVRARPGKQARASGDGHDPQGHCCGPCPPQTRLRCTRLCVSLAPSTRGLRNPLVSAYLWTPTPCQRETRLRARLPPPSPHWWAVATSRGCCSAREGVPDFPHCPQGLWVTEIKQRPWQAESSTALLEWAPSGGEQSPSALTQKAAPSLPTASPQPPSASFQPPLSLPQPPSASLQPSLSLLPASPQPPFSLSLASPQLPLSPPSASSLHTDPFSPGPGSLMANSHLLVSGAGTAFPCSMVQPGAGRVGTTGDNGPARTSCRGEEASAGGEGERFPVSKRSGPMLSLPSSSFPKPII